MARTQVTSRRNGSDSDSSSSDGIYVSATAAPARNAAQDSARKPERARKSSGRPSEAESSLHAREPPSNGSDLSSRPHKRKRSDSSSSSQRQLREDRNAVPEASPAPSSSNNSNRSSAKARLPDISKPTPVRRARPSVPGKSRLVQEIGDSSEASDKEQADSGSSDEEVITVSAQPYQRKTRNQYEKGISSGPKAGPSPSKEREAAQPEIRYASNEAKASSSRKERSPKVRTAPASPRVVSKQRANESQERVPASPLQVQRSQQQQLALRASEEASEPDMESLRLRILSLEAIVKKKDKQIEKEKQLRNKGDEAFNELGDANGRLRKQRDELERQLSEIKRAAQSRSEKGNHDLNKMTDQLSEIRAQNTKLQQAVFELRAENDKLTLAARGDADYQRKAQLDTLKEREERLSRDRKAHSARVQAFEEQQNTTAIESRNRILALEEELRKSRADQRLAEKEREIEGIYARHGRDLEAIQQKHENQIRGLQQELSLQKVAVNIDRHANSGTPDSVQAGLLAEIERLSKEQRDIMRYADAHAQTNDAKLAKARESERRAIEECEKKVREVRAARDSLETQNERYRLAHMDMKDESKKLREENAHWRALQDEYTRLAEENPLLQKENKALQTERRQLLASDTRALEERSVYTDVINKLRQENAAALEEARQYTVDAERFRTDRAKIQEEREIQLIERRRSEQEKKQLLQRNKQLARTIKKLKRGGIPDGQVSSDDDSEDASGEEAASAEDVQQSEGRARSPIAGLDNHNGMEIDAGHQLHDLSSPEPPEPRIPPPPLSDRREALLVQATKLKEAEQAKLAKFESTQPVYQYPPLMRKRRPDSKVPRAKTRVYVRSECHTPYVPDETVSDSDDEFLPWELQAYAKTQLQNPDERAASLNVCWNRWILDSRSQRVRSQNLAFCTEFVRVYAELIASANAGEALLRHMLQLVKLGQLTPEEGASVMKVYHESY